jgi:hypothetical protein
VQACSHGSRGQALNLLLLREARQQFCGYPAYQHGWKEERIPNQRICVHRRLSPHRHPLPHQEQCAGRLGHGDLHYALHANLPIRAVSAIVAHGPCRRGPVLTWSSTVQRTLDLHLHRRDRVCPSSIEGYSLG